MTSPSVSVIIPAYNQAEYLSATLDSVAEQTYPGPVEVIVVDDESPDDSAAIAEAHDLKPTVIRQRNTGVAGARNRGIEAASGTYIAFLDSDDRWLPEKLERQIAELEDLATPALSFTRYRRVHVDGSTPREPLHPSESLRESKRHLLFQNFIGCSTVVVHRDCLDDTDLFPTDPVLQRGGQDYALWLRVAAFHPLLYQRSVMTLYAVHPNNRVGTDPFKHFEGGLNALHSFRQSIPVEVFNEMAGVSYRRVVMARTLSFLKDRVIRRDAKPSEWMRPIRAAQAVWNARST
jgi:glycosyltransferase involved in cell wall biosynthesis